MARKALPKDIVMIQQAIKRIRDLKETDTKDNEVFSETLAEAERSLHERLYREIENSV